MILPAAKQRPGKDAVGLPYRVGWEMQAADRLQGALWSGSAPAVGAGQGDNAKAVFLPRLALVGQDIQPAFMMLHKVLQAFLSWLHACQLGFPGSACIQNVNLQYSALSVRSSLTGGAQALQTTASGDGVSDLG